MERIAPRSSARVFLAAVDVRVVCNKDRVLGLCSLAEKSEAHAVSNREVPRSCKTAIREVDDRNMVC
jgi:hypothetical protein